MKHTETPWRSDGQGEYIFAGIIMVCQMRGWGHLTGSGGLRLSDEKAVEIQKANQELIVRAVNAHDELVAALKMARDAIEYCKGGPNQLAEIDAALSKAGAL